MHIVVPVIMSGGSGTRLWPVSTPEAPKQFHRFGGEGAMLQETARRFMNTADAGVSFAAPVVICNARHAALVERQLVEIGAPAAAILLEPFGRNTAAAAVLAAAAVEELYGADARVLLLPADHLIADVAAFHAAIVRAVSVSDARIVTFGITPQGPETGFGYIKRGEPIGEGVFAIDSFREKPNRALAEEYLAEGGYDWNGGIFLFRPDVLLRESPADIRDAAMEAYRAAPREGVFVRLSAELFAKTPDSPVDIAVMERTAHGAVAPCSIGWADVGSWTEYGKLLPEDSNGNAIAGRAALLDVERCVLRADGVTIAAAGVQDLIIVATPEAVLILPKDRAQDVKALAAQVAAMTAKA